jgi:TIR domain
MADVFISYKKEDLRRVEPLARALAAAGYEVWWDHRIPAGRSYRDVIGAALQSAKCVMVVWSNLSASAQWVLDEADEGKRRGVLLPVLIDDVEIPYGFRQIEAARLVGWSGDTAHPEWANVLTAVQHFVGRAPGAPPKSFTAPAAPVGGAPAPRSRFPTGLALGLAAAVLLIGAGYYASRSGLLSGGGAALTPASVTTDASHPAEQASAPSLHTDDAARSTQTTPPEQSTTGQPPTTVANTGHVAVEAARPNQPLVVTAARLTDGVSRLTLNQGPFLVRETAGTWVEVDQGTGQPGARWTEVRRDGDTIELRDDGRNAGMRIELGENWLYLYFPDWGDYRRQWSISAVERAP